MPLSQRGGVVAVVAVELAPGGVFVAARFVTGITVIETVVAISGFLNFYFMNFQRSPRRYLFFVYLGPSITFSTLQVPFR